MTARSMLVPAPILALALAAAAAPQSGALGRSEAGAMMLAGYLVDNHPCLPVKRFAADAGYLTNVSPSRRSFAVIVGNKTSYVLGMTTASVDGERFPLPVAAFERDGDFFVPLDFYRKAFPGRFTWDARRKTVVAELPGKKVLKVPIRALPKAATR